MAMIALFILLAAADLGMGLFCFWGLTQLPPGASVSLFLPPENMLYMVYTTACLLAPVVGWRLRSSHSTWAALAVVALPILFAAAMGSFRIAIR